MQINYKHKSLFFQKDGSSFYEFNIVNSKFLVYQIYKFDYKSNKRFKQKSRIFIPNKYLKFQKKKINNV